MLRHVQLLVAAAIATASQLDADPAFRMEGRVFPLRCLDVVSSIDGVVRKVNVEDGAEVSKGDILFELDDTQQQAQVESCKAELGVALAEAGRAERLYLRMSGSDVRGTTAVALDEAKSAHETTRCNRDRAKALLKIAEDELSRMRIRAPFDGRIAFVTVTEGSFAATYREPLAKLVQMDPVRVAFKVPVDGRRRLKGATVRLLTPEGGEYGSPGKVDFEGNETLEDGKTVIVGATFPNPGRELLPGMKVAVEVYPGDAKKVGR